MKVYVTTKNTGPSWQRDPLHLLYLGTSIKDAEAKVPESFHRYQKDETEFPKLYPDLYTALPRDMVGRWEFVQYYMADGWWYSIVMLDLKEA